MTMRNIEGKVFESEWSQINTDTGIEIVHEHKMYVLNDNGEQTILNNYKNNKRSIIQAKINNI